MTTTSIRKESQLCTETGKKMRFSMSDEISTGEGIQKWPTRHQTSSVPGPVNGDDSGIRRVEDIHIEPGSPPLEDQFRGEAA